ncbi:uncharacterized protein ACHE_60810A [Aspergillus chevalieri]|uniref:Uncharacterized protein n=1 Tax=Aspergillus chevalieri TaxID=182096 RepID=A0A7R7VVI4_ASPCH|nr:uncharacterized protein ACHE_60810A [Aspergillus chevalieri]BCR90924.1 hypothetical protein ACHE_60810A [Aspergillus chevalieri]
MVNRPVLPKKGGAWARVVIFISLYVLLLESLIEWVLILYLYGIKRVDSKMMPSLILSLIASFLTVPLLSIHSLLAWQFNKAGRGPQKNALSNISAYALRLNVAIWLSASVAGLVVVSQQASCLPDDSNASYWRVGVSCALHRATVIVEVLSFITICIYFCSRELCDRPYDVSLLGVYNQQNRTRDGSITSNTSWDSENTLKNDILYYCRRPEPTYGGPGLHWPSNDDTMFEKPEDVTAIQPAPFRAKPQLKLSTTLVPESAEFRSGSVSPMAAASETDPVSRTSTVLTSGTNEPPSIAELPAPEVPQIPTKFSHKRQKSSMSLRKFLPRSLPISLPLSDDPQIRALSNPNIYFDLEKEAEKAFLSDSSESFQRPNSPLKADIPKHQSCPIIQLDPPQQDQRTMTMSSADAPEVVDPEPQKIQRSNTATAAAHLSQPLPRSMNHPHHPSQLRSVPSTSVMQSLTRGPSTASVHSGARLITISPSPEPKQQQPDIRRLPSRRYSNSTTNSSNTNRRSSQLYQFDQSQAPRHFHRPHPHFNYPLRHNIGTVPRRNDVEIIYPSTRRSRSSTYGGISSIVPLDSIMESRASFDEVPGCVGADDNGASAGVGVGAHIIDENTYRGTNWTSMPGSGC